MRNFLTNLMHKEQGKTTTLKMIGVMLPFLMIPGQLGNQYGTVRATLVVSLAGANRSISGDRSALLPSEPGI
jgi:hypothetical protein